MVDLHLGSWLLVILYKDFCTKQCTHIIKNVITTELMEELDRGLLKGNFCIKEYGIVGRKRDFYKSSSD